MSNKIQQSDLNAVLLNSIQEFVVDELVTKHDQKIDLVHRLTTNGSLLIEITSKAKQKKVIIHYSNGQIVTTPKARRRINSGTKYVPNYIEISANVHAYEYGNEEYLKSIEPGGYATSSLKSLSSHLIRELLNDTGYPIAPNERIYAKPGKISNDHNTYLNDFTDSSVSVDTEFYRVINLDETDCFENEDKVKTIIADNVNYSNYLAGKEFTSYQLNPEDSPIIEDIAKRDINVGDYVIVYYAENKDDRKQKMRKVVRFLKPQAFTHWFRI